MDLALSSYNAVRLTVDKIDAAELEIYRLFFLLYLFFIAFLIFFYLFIFLNCINCTWLPVRGGSVSETCNFKTPDEKITG